MHVEPRGPRKLRHTAELTMGVSPEARGLGIGRELLDAALDKLRTDNIIEILYLTVRADNIAAIRLYERCGFEKLTLLERDTQIGDRYYDGVLMRRFIEKAVSTSAGEQPPVDRTER
ncbi:MAG: N-acetyltransferase [Propionivibrio sp.]